MSSIRTSLAFVALVVMAPPLAAQARGPGSDKVPRGHLPPPGMCRIWIDGVPPGRQPEPTDCATARRRVPRNARVVYGDRVTEARGDDRWNDRARRETDGRYDGRYDDRKDDDRTSEARKGDYEKDEARKDDRGGNGGIRIFDEQDDEERSKTGDRKDGGSAGNVPDRKTSDLTDTTRKR